MAASRRHDLCSSFAIYVFSNARSCILVIGWDTDAESWSCKPSLLLETEAALKEEYPMYMRLSDVSDVTGIKQNRATRDFLEGLTIYTF